PEDLAERGDRAARLDLAARPRELGEPGRRHEPLGAFEGLDVGRGPERRERREGEVADREVRELDLRRAPDQVERALLERERERPGDEGLAEDADQPRQLERPGVALDRAAQPLDLLRERLAVVARARERLAERLDRDERRVGPDGQLERERA